MCCDLVRSAQICDALSRPFAQCLSRMTREQARGKIFTASIGSVDSLYPYVYIYMPCIEKEPIYDMYCIRRQYQRFLNILFWGCLSGAVGSVYVMSGVVLGGVVEVVGANLARGKIFTASIGSVDSLYPSVFIYCLNLHQFLILCSSKAMMFVKLYFRTSDIYLISLVSLDPSGFHLRTK